VELQQYSTSNEVWVLAHKAEQQKKRNPPRHEFPKFQARTAPFNKGSSNHPPGRTIVQPPVQSRTQNHPYPSFPQNTPAPQKAYPPMNRSNQGPMNLRRCFKCQGLGHIAAYCPNHRVISLAQWDAVKEEMAEEEKEESIEALEEEEEEVIAEADEGEMLVLRRALSSQKGEQEEQQENIFHSRCTVPGKVCSMIIDSGSCANVVSLSMIEKLNLQTSVHPHPYNIQWLNHSKGLQVNSRYLISFSIGKNYQAELWFDVIPMDACHMLLRRP